MRIRSAVPVAALAALCLDFSAIALAHDVDGPDCGRALTDFGDAPEGIRYSNRFGTGLGKFPTCLSPGPIGTVEAFCAPLGTPPGPAGYVRHVHTGVDNFWLGAWGPADARSGIDGELDGKVSSAQASASACNSAVTVDYTSSYNSNELRLGQDEMYWEREGGNPDGAIQEPRVNVACMQEFMMDYSIANCGSARRGYLNVLVDWNRDGDWNDNVKCTPFGFCSSLCAVEPCIQEWSIKNLALDIPVGANFFRTPPIHIGTSGARFAWLRLTLTGEPVNDDFPWAGSATMPDGSFSGGETEDYELYIDFESSAARATWGRLKMLYR